MTLYIKYEPNEDLVREANKLLQCSHINTPFEKEKYALELENMMHKILRHNHQSAIKQIDEKMLLQTGVKDFYGKMSKFISLNEQMTWYIGNIIVCEEADEHLHKAMLSLSDRVQKIWEENTHD